MSLPTFALHPPVIAAIIDAGGPQIVCDALAAGESYSAIAKRFGGSRGALMRWMSQLPPDVQQQIREADAQGASALVEETLAIADGITDKMLATEKGPLASDIATAEKTRIATRQWFAERKDKDTWGAKPQSETVVNIQTIHLDALRHYHAPKLAGPIAVIAAPAEPTDIAELL